MSALAARRGMAGTSTVTTTSKYALLIAFTIFALFPLIWMWVAALRNSGEVYATPFSLPSRLDFGNIAKASGTLPSGS